jgi:hypothetical protein
MPSSTNFYNYLKQSLLRAKQYKQANNILSFVVKVVSQMEVLVNRLYQIYNKSNFY